MNREIKFRAFTKLGMLHDVVYSAPHFWLHIDAFDEQVNPPESGENCGDDELDKFDLFTGEECVMGESPVMQFTGLRDQSGIEVYEDDIIKTLSGFIGKVVFKSHSYKTKTDIYQCHGWVFERISDGHCEFLDDEILCGQVVGNIHENPELLNHA